MSVATRNRFLALSAGMESELGAGVHFDAAGHLWRQDEIDALIFACAARRPLLVRGEAGSGKSQIARAAARVLYGGEPLVEVIHPRFEALDLLYRFDAVKRLADAQVSKLGKTNERYVRRGRLWEALERIVPGEPLPVLLIDEIDKADADVPNALLDVLGNRAFTVPLLNNLTVRAPGGQLPLVVITTNEERELPPAFVRRCIVLNLNPPNDDAAFVDWLVRCSTAHRHLEIDDEARVTAAEQVLKDRKEAARHGYAKVGLAEFIDLLTALYELTVDAVPQKRGAAQQEWLARLRPYVLRKDAAQLQRDPEGPIATPFGAKG